MGAFPADKLRQAIDLLNDIGSNHCDHLSYAQSALLHNAAQMLFDLDNDLGIEDEGDQ